MNALIVLPGYHKNCKITFVIPWKYHEGRYDALHLVTRDGFDALAYVPAGSADNCTFDIVEGGVEVEEPQIRVA